MKSAQTGANYRQEVVDPEHCHLEIETHFAAEGAVLAAQIGQHKGPDDEDDKTDYPAKQALIQGRFLQLHISLHRLVVEGSLHYL
jgi:hypothetical protein